MNPEINKYQIAGLDQRGRGFNRLAEVLGSKENYDASLLYETSRFRTEKHQNCYRITQNTSRLRIRRTEQHEHLQSGTELFCVNSFV